MNLRPATAIRETAGPLTLPVAGVGTDLHVLSRVSGSVIGVTRLALVNATRFVQIVDTQPGGDGYVSVNLPTYLEWVEFDIQASGGSGFAGASGAPTSARKGGDPGSSGARTRVLFRRLQLPDTVFVRIGIPTVSPAVVQHTLVEAVKSLYTSSTLAPGDAPYRLGYAVAASTASTPVVATPQLAVGLKIGLSTLYPGSAGSLATAGGTQPADYVFFGSTVSGAAGPGCGGGGLLITSGTPSAGGGYGAIGPFSARAGGAATGVVGVAGIYGGGDAAGWISSASSLEKFAWGYGGTGGGASNSGTGGAGGAGAPGCGGGGGGAGLLVGGAGGLGGMGFVIVRGW